MDASAPNNFLLSELWFYEKKKKSSATHSNGTMSQSGQLFEYLCSRVLQLTLAVDSSCNFVFTFPKLNRDRTQYERQCLAEFDFVRILQQKIEKKQVFENFSLFYQNSDYKYNEFFLANSLFLVETKIRLLEKDDNKSPEKCYFSKEINESRDSLYKRYFLPLICETFMSKFWDKKTPFNIKKIPKIYLIFITNGAYPKFCNFEKIQNLFEPEKNDLSKMMKAFEEDIISYLDYKKTPNSVVNEVLEFVENTWNNVEVAFYWTSQLDLSDIMLQKFGIKYEDEIRKKDDEIHNCYDEIHKKDDEILQKNKLEKERIRNAKNEGLSDEMIMRIWKLNKEEFLSLMG